MGTSALRLRGFSGRKPPDQSLRPDSDSATARPSAHRATVTGRRGSAVGRPPYEHPCGRALRAPERGKERLDTRAPQEVPRASITGDGASSARCPYDGRSACSTRRSLSVHLEVSYLVVCEGQSALRRAARDAVLAEAEPTRRSSPRRWPDGTRTRSPGYGTPCPARSRLGVLPREVG